MTPEAIRSLSDSMRMKGHGVLDYRGNRLVLNIDGDTSAYYRSLIPEIDLLPPSFGDHITVAVTDHELAPLLKGIILDFEYSHMIRYSGDTTNDKPATFYFLDVWCPDMILIRQKCGLETWLRFHLTIGKVKC